MPANGKSWSIAVYLLSQNVTGELDKAAQKIQEMD
jgi:hypothetical protein